MQILNKGASVVTVYIMRVKVTSEHRKSECRIKGHSFMTSTNRGERGLKIFDSFVDGCR